MVSFWPFKGQDNSAASFEKLLSSLSTKINKESARNQSLRQRQRRYKVLWTLYTSFAYISAALILTLVTGWQNWTAVEYTALAGAPLFIYAIRTALDAAFNYRVANSQNHLNALHRQRDAAIANLKEATKYNSTQQLLEKYGGESPSRPATGAVPTSGPKVGGAQPKQSAPAKQLRGARTGIAPPPTANIPGRVAAAFPNTPQDPSVSSPLQQHSLPPPPPPPNPDLQAEFAPNAFSDPPPPPPQAYTTSTGGSAAPRWFDRILDVVLGEDETQPKNRIVLVCKACRLVNGQAPPGTRSLDDVGTWRCMSCHTTNGTESQTKDMIQKIVSEETRGREEEEEVEEEEEAEDRGGDDALKQREVKRRATTLDRVQDNASSDDEAESLRTTPPPSASTRSKAKKRSNK